MRKKLLLYPLFLFFSPVFSYGQVTFTTIPMDSQLVARNLNTNMGTFAVQGIVDSTGTPYDTICLKIFRDSVAIDSMYQGLYYANDSAPFSFSFQILAELHEYRISVYGIKKAVQTPDTTINALLAGDVYIIEGQSNALAMQRDGQNADTNKSEFIRVFARPDTSVTGLLANLAWFRGEGNGSFTENGHAGQWGLRLGRLLVDSIKIPVAIFNGAFGGTPISYYERPANYKTSLYSNYARLYYRMTYTGLENNVRAIMWSQGESDAADGTSTATYINEFDTLQKAWQQDFPGFKKTYIFQTKTETVEPIYNIMVIEEAQRQVTLAHDSDIEIMSTAALTPDAGGLHFDYTGGYEEFGNRIYQLIARDIYGIANRREIDAPMITAAFMDDSTTIVIAEKANALWQHDTAYTLQTSPILCYQLENATPGTIIDSIFPYKNDIILKLSKYPGSGVTVSYLAPVHNTGTNWLTNTNNLEPVCFYKYPVADSIGRIFTDVQTYRESVLSIYPNPFHDYTNIVLPKSGRYSLEVDDLSGKAVHSARFSGTRYRLSAVGLAKGIYLLRVFDKKNNVIDSAKIGVE